MEATLSARAGQKLSKLSLSIDQLLLHSSNNQADQEVQNPSLPHLPKLKSSNFSSLRIRLAQENLKDEPVTWDEVNESLVESFDYRTIAPNKIEIKGSNGISEIMTVLWASLVLDGVEYDVLQGWADRLNLAIHKVLSAYSSKEASQNNGFVSSSAPSPELVPVKYTSRSATTSPAFSFPRTFAASSSPTSSTPFNTSTFLSRESGSLSSNTSGSFTTNSSSPPKPLLPFMSEKAMGKRRQEEIEPSSSISTKKVRTVVEEVPHITRSVSMQAVGEPPSVPAGSVEPPHITRSVSTQLIEGSSGLDGLEESTQTSTSVSRVDLVASSTSDINPSNLSLADYIRLALPIPSNLNLSTLSAFRGRDLNTTDLKFTREEICWKDDEIVSEGLVKKKDSTSTLPTYDYSRKHLHLFPSKNIMPRSTGDPFLFLSNRQQIKLFRDLSPWNVFLTNEEGKVWIYIGTYKVILATTTSISSMKHMHPQRRQILKQILLGHSGSSTTNGTIAGKEARNLFEGWGFSSLSVNGSLDELDQGLGAGITFAVAKCIGFDEANFKIWDKRRKK